MKLNRKISLAAGLFTTVMILLIGLLVIQQWFSTLQTQLELAAKDMAFTVSEMDVVRSNLIRSNGSIPIQRKMTELKLSSRIQYIHVVNKEGLYYSHTTPARLGTREEDPLIQSLLHSANPAVTVRQRKDSLIPAVEAVSPVYYKGEMVGLVITGMLNGRVYQEISLNIRTFCFFMILAVFISLYSSAFLSYSIKKSMYGLEPEEIARLLGQKEMTLENLKEGIITIDQNSRIIYFNPAAGELTGLNTTDLERPASLYFFRDGFRECLERNVPVHKELHSPRGIQLQCRFEPITDSQTKDFLGATVLLEDLTTIRSRAEELTGIKQINEGLRAQNHEFLNKLHTISGLIQLEEYDEAIQYITGTSRNRQAIIARLSDTIKDPSVAGLLLGKYNKAQEQKTAFHLEESSFLSGGNKNSEILNLILGNLIENSLEELIDIPEGEIRIIIRERRESLQLQVTDNGGGIRDTEKVFEKGVSSKGADRGLGLFFVKEKVKKTGGILSLHSESGRTCFTIEIPLEKE